MGAFHHGEVREQEEAGGRVGGRSVAAARAARGSLRNFIVRRYANYCRIETGTALVVSGMRVDQTHDDVDDRAADLIRLVRSPVLDELFECIGHVLATGEPALLDEAHRMSGEGEFVSIGYGE